MTTRASLDAELNALVRRAQQRLNAGEVHEVGLPTAWRRRPMRRGKLQRAWAEVSKQVQHIALHYPVPELRKRFSEVAHFLISGAVEFVPLGEYFAKDEGNQVTTMMIIRPPGEKTMLLLFLPALQETETALRSSLPPQLAETCVEDNLVLLFLHEGFHLLNQEHVSSTQQGDADGLVRKEMDCWADTCANVLQPMVAAGRAPVLRIQGGDVFGRDMNEVFLLLGNDAASPLWRRYMERMYLDHETPSAE